MELADGTKTMNVAVKRGDAEVALKDVNGRYVKTVLSSKKAITNLFIRMAPRSQSRNMVSYII